MFISIFLYVDVLDLRLEDSSEEEDSSNEVEVEIDEETIIKYYFQRGFSKSIQFRRRLTTYFFQLCSVNQSLSLTGCVYLSPYKRLKGVWACQI